MTSVPIALPPFREAGGREILPDNRWDLAKEAEHTPTVSVVIPYYEQPRQLALVLEALTTQTYPRELIDVVVADDGSATPPDIDQWAADLSITVVRQENRGFRAAAARNLGAAASNGSILCFLDADTVPVPDYVRRAVRLPSAAPDVMVVGRRKHADLSSVTVDTVATWIADNSWRARSHESEPQWLVDGYERTADLLEPGWDGYKYMLSAVLTCSRQLFLDTGGFDSTFVRYGGEDWEFANRAFMMGAVFAHASDALAWHDGPDWAERAVPDRISSKNAEALALASSITDPAARTSGLHYWIPDFVVLVSTLGHTAASLSLTIASAVRGSDSAVWLVGDDAVELHTELRIDDSRVRSGVPEAAILARCRFAVAVSGRVRFSPDTLARLADEVGPGRAGEVVVVFDAADSATVTMQSSRAVHRARRWSARAETTEEALRRILFGAHRIDRAESGITVERDEPRLSW
ncbi:glycosyltransferase [Rhodococcus sp. G-MC3]|uniref:glycosyltransferase n=1 Tax=Rhodococcus sp. G-MC3 TaxID=3046209 RepID=UPI0024BB3E88|nr:glycosyltransferase [Rhodococcus sp. G-MC3]MDJ0392865.1 glycosyltransferase [Rhodococcus sp. G-MC3]